MKYYDKIAAGYNELHEAEQINKLNIIKQNLKVKKTDTILDVGCGTGVSFKFFDNITGIDPSKEMIKQARGKVIQGTAENLPFKDKEFDIVISVTAIHNFKDIEKGLKEIKRVGKRYVLTILRKAEKFDEINELIRKMFRVEKAIVESKDLILFLK